MPVSNKKQNGLYLNTVFVLKYRLHITINTLCSDNKYYEELPQCLRLDRIIKTEYSVITLQSVILW